ncbi:MAG TPA: cupin domain-containing protein [Baekduia sp.]
MKVIRPGGALHEEPRGVVGGHEVSRATTGTDSNIFMGIFRLPAGARSRPHFHADCESACYMLSGRMRIHWGERLEHTVELGRGDMLWVPPHETHVLENPSADEDAEYVVARDSPTEDAVEVPWVQP